MQLDLCTLWGSRKATTSFQLSQTAETWAKVLRPHFRNTMLLRY
jgi:hypothetical protein